MHFTLIKDDIICNITYFGEGVVYQSSYNSITDKQGAIPIYRDNKKDALTFMVREVARMLNDGWELSVDEN